MLCKTGCEYKIEINRETMKNHKILIVDDEPTNIMLLKDVLKDDNYEVSTAMSGEQALELMPIIQPDLILLDVLLSGIDGYEVCKRIRANKRFRLVKIMMISAMAMLEERLKGYDAGADDYIVKPFKKEELLAKIRIMKKLKESEAYNEQYRNRLEAILRSVKDGIVTVDNEMKIIMANESSRRICGILSQQVMGEKYDEIFNNCSKACHHILKETLNTQKTIDEHHIECIHNNNSRQEVKLSGAPLKDENNEVIGAVLVSRDTTKISDLERELVNRYQFHNIIGKNAKMQSIYKLVENLADTNTTVLIIGESGTGKELVAKAIHYSSTRAQQPLIKVNCAALSENLLESELFGHVRGAFTGALKDRVGRFQAANNGTIFLDEIGDISPLIQLKLLRVLQEREFEKVGDTSTYKINVRVMAATNQDLKKKVRLGEFREDLYYRLKVVEIDLPPLRDRVEDVPLLFTHFCKMYNKEFNKKIEGLSDEVLRIFMDYDWPGNVRELQHSIEHAFVLCKDRVITREYLPSELRDVSRVRSLTSRNRLKDSLDESQTILEVLNKTGWNKAKSARILGVSRPTLYKKVKQYKLVNEDLNETDY